MSTTKQHAGIGHILCPTDLSSRSQKALSYAMQIATDLGAMLTAFHSAKNTWPYHANGSATHSIDEIKTEIRNGLVRDTSNESVSIDLSVIVEESTDPAAAI